MNKVINYLEEEINFKSKLSNEEQTSYNLIFSTPKKVCKSLNNKNTYYINFKEDMILMYVVDEYNNFKGIESIQYIDGIRSDLIQVYPKKYS